jgi:hypothetical protein
LGDASGINRTWVHQMTSQFLEDWMGVDYSAAADRDRGAKRTCGARRLAHGRVERSRKLPPGSLADQLASAERERGTRVRGDSLSQERVQCPRAEACGEPVMRPNAP